MEDKVFCSYTKQSPSKCMEAVPGFSSGREHYLLYTALVPPLLHCPQLHPPQLQ